MRLRHTLAMISALALFALAAPQAEAVVTLQQTIKPDTVRPGERIVVSLTVTNDSITAEANLELRALIPAQFNAVNRVSNASPTALCTGNNPCAPGNQLIWALGTIPAGRAVTVSYWSTVQTGAGTPVDGTSIHATAQVFQSALLRDDDDRSVIVDSGKALTLALEDDLDPVEPGAALTYTLVYGNRSIDSVTNTTLSFPVPAGTTVLSADGGTVAAGNVTWNLGTLLTGQSGRRQVVVSVGAGAAGTLLRADPASISGTSPSGAESARASELTSVQVAPSLGLAAAVNPDPLRPGERVRTELTVSNRSGGALANVQVSTRLPDGAVSVNIVNNATGAPACTGNNPCAPGNQLTWTIGALAAGQTVTVAYWTTVNTGASAPPNGDLLGVDAVATADGGHQAQASHTVPVNANKALTLELDDDLDTVGANGALTYTLHYGNRSIGTVNNAVLGFPVPPGTTVLAADGGTVSNGIVSWNLGALLAGQSGRRQVVVTVGSAPPSGTLLRVNAATVAGTGAAGTESARATEVTRVEAADALALAVAVNPDPARPGERLRADLTVSNQSAASIFNVRLTSRVPDQTGGVNVIGNANGGAGCTSSNPCGLGNQLVWALGTLAPGQTVTVSYWTLVASGASAPANGEQLLVDAAVTADGSHQALASRAVPVHANRALNLELDDDLDTVTPGSTLTYTLRYGNRSISNVTNAMLTLPAPAGTTVVDAGGGTLSNGIVTFALGTLAPGQSGQRQVVVSVGAGLAGGALLRVNAASLAGNSNAGPESARASEVTRVESADALGLAVVVNPDPVRPGERLRADLAVRNRTDTTLFNVRITARVSDLTGAVNVTVNATGAPACTGSNPCGAGGQLVWTIGMLPPGATTAVSYWTLVVSGAAAPLNGDLIAVDAAATADGSHQAIASHTVAVHTEKPLVLELDDDLDAVLPGELLTYTLSYGNRSLTTITGATLRFPLPAGTTLQGDGGGSVANGVVSWNVGALTPGQVGRRVLALEVDAATPVGGLLRVDAAELTGTSPSGAVYARGTEVTRVQNVAPLVLHVEAAPEITGPALATTATLTVRNPGLDPVFGVTLAARIPDESGSVNRLTNATGTPACTGSNPCGAGGQLIWDLGTIAPGQTATVTYTGTILSGASSPPAGTPIVFDARATEQSGTVATHSATALVGPFTDLDADGVADVLDNCTLVANPDQRDSNGDGYGNACDADLNNDGIVNAVDLAQLKSVFFRVNEDADLNGDGIVNAVDLARLKSVFFRPPGPSALAP